MLCSWESPFANCLAGAPGGDYLSRAIVDCRGAPTADTAFMGLTSCRRITIAETLAALGGASAQTALADCRVAVERAADHYTLICDGPEKLIKHSFTGPTPTRRALTCPHVAGGR